MPSTPDLVLTPNEKTRRWIDLILPVMAVTAEAECQCKYPQQRGRNPLCGSDMAVDNLETTVPVLMEQALPILKAIGVVALEGEESWKPRPGYLPALVADWKQAMQNRHEYALAGDKSQWMFLLHHWTALIASTMLPNDTNRQGWYCGSNDDLCRMSNFSIGLTDAPVIVIQDWKKQRCYFYGFMDYALRGELQEWNNGRSVTFQFGGSVSMAKLERQYNAEKLYLDFSQPMWTETHPGTQFFPELMTWDLFPQIMKEMTSNA